FLSMISLGLAVVLGALIGILQILFRNRVEARRLAMVGGAEIETGVPEVAEEQHYEPETYRSLFMSLIGYLLLVDTIGKLVPKAYIYFFGEDPREAESVEEDDSEVEPTMIPFGPYLAAGALITMFFSGPLTKVVMNYWNSMMGP